MCIEAALAIQRGERLGFEQATAGGGQYQSSGAGHCIELAASVVRGATYQLPIKMARPAIVSHGDRGFFPRFDSQRDAEPFFRLGQVGSEQLPHQAEPAEAQQELRQPCPEGRPATARLKARRSPRTDQTPTVYFTAASPSAANASKVSEPGDQTSMTAARNSVIKPMSRMELTKQA